MSTVMRTALRVGIAPVPRRHIAAPAQPLLTGGGAEVILGATPAMATLAEPVTPTPSTMFGPRGACLGADGSLWVADTGHHRLLGWSQLPTQDATPADYCIGQPDFYREGRNAKSEPSATSLNVPSGLCACGEGLAVADGWNHRVLIWRQLPSRQNQPADLVLGQADFHAAEQNRGSPAPTASSLFWPFAVAWDGKRLWVADTGNRRVLVWNGLPAHNGQPGDLVLGQLGFDCRDENGGGAPNASSLRWPHGIAFLGGRVCIADAGNNRIMVWQQLPSRNGQNCDAILGQRDAASVDHNLGDYWPSSAALNMPYAVTTVGDWLIAADTASSRLVAWPADALQGFGASAQRLAAQDDWQSKGDNRWLAAARDSLCWPYGLSGNAEQAVIADAGNNRVLLWRWHEELRQAPTAAHCHSKQSAQHEVLV